jgi:hypothetical protein
MRSRVDRLKGMGVFRIELGGGVLKGSVWSLSVLRGRVRVRLHRFVCKEGVERGMSVRSWYWILEYIDIEMERKKENRVMMMGVLRNYIVIKLHRLAQLSYLLLRYVTQFAVLIVNVIKVNVLMDIVLEKDIQNVMWVKFVIEM